MREIKFRAWDGSHMIYCPGVFLKGASRFFGLLEPTDDLMQYTGLKDKNGREIYEGDIVSVRTGFFDEDGTEHYRDEPDGIERIVFDPVCGVMGMFRCNVAPNEPQEWEVIGNIHESPELLEVDNEQD